MSLGQSPSSSLLTRSRAHLGLKLGMAVGLNVWALVPYFWLQRHAFFPVTIMEESSLDVWIGFSPDAVWIYLSLFLLLPVAPVQMEKTSQLWRYAFGVAAMSVAADLIFFFWPTAVTRANAEPVNAVYASLVTWIPPLNAFPSLHAAMAVFSALCCEQIFARLRHPGVWRIVIWTWALGIIWATLSTKEHVVVDALGGLVLGLTSYWWAFRNRAARETESRLKVMKREGWTA